MKAEAVKDADVCVAPEPEPGEWVDLSRVPGPDDVPLPGMEPA